MAESLQNQRDSYTFRILNFFGSHNHAPASNMWTFGMQSRRVPFILAVASRYNALGGPEIARNKLIGAHISTPSTISANLT